MFSFEMKVSLTFENLRESYFQTVSNSSWAKEGYLVAIDISADDDFQDELRRLTNAFGIGIIKLNVPDPYQSEIVFPARTNQQLDWNTVDRLYRENKNFKDLIDSVMDDMQVGKVRGSYDEVMDDDTLSRWIRNKKINRI